MNTTLTQPDGDDSLPARQTYILESPTDFPEASGARKMGLGKTGWVLLGCLLAAGPASANLVLNGSFETPLVNGAGNARCDTWGANNWNFYYGKSPEAVYIYNTAQIGLTPASAGVQAQVFFPLNDVGGAEPYISQTLSTVPGQTYDISFDLAAAVWYGQGTTVTVSWLSDGVDQIGQWSQAQGTNWETKHFIVTAGSTNDTIKFTYADFQPGHWGASIIDNVQVTAVTESGPGAVLLSIARSGAGVLLSWPSPSAGFVLQENSDIGTTIWLDVAQTPADDGTNKTVTISPPIVGSQFYRLLKVPEVWKVNELTFTSASNYANPYTEVQFSATFSGPGGVGYTVPGFWDGGTIWRIRFTPTVPGVWSYTTTSSNPADAGLNGKSGSFTARAPASSNPIYQHGGFLKVSTNGHYFTYTDTTPFFYLEDTWWSCPSDIMPFDTSSDPNATGGAFPTLVDKRKSQNFSVVRFGFLQAWNYPLAIPDRFKRVSIVDISFWRNVDRYMAYANDAALIPIVGFTSGDGMDAYTLNEWETAWRYFVARYGAYGVSFLICGEYNANATADDITKVLTLGQFIKDTDPYKRAMSVHPWWYGGDLHQAWSQAWYDFIMFQGAHFKAPPPYTTYYNAYNTSPIRPVVEAECRFENIEDYDTHTPFTDADVRLVAYRAIQSGCAGYSYGAHGLWYPTQNTNDTLFWDVFGHSDPWYVAMNYPGATEMGYMRSLYESVEWWKLVPLPTAVTASGLSEAQRILTKADSTSTFVIYFPAGVSATKTAILSGASASSTYGVQWFNPSTGVWANGSDLISSVIGTCTMPNRPGAGDWVLVLRKR